MIGLQTKRRARAPFSLARLLLAVSLLLLAIGASGAMDVRHAWTSLPARTALLVFSTAFLLLRHRKREGKGAAAFPADSTAPDAGTG